jgi:nucleoid-associated protein YgaU
MMGVGNEAKIGVGVILGLFVILCVVLAVRISGEKARAAAAAATAKDTSAKDPTAGDVAAPRLLSASQPTTVSASGASTMVLKAPINASGWNLASDRATAVGGSSDIAASTPPSLMPNPQTPTVTTVALTTSDSAAPTTIPAAATETVANATPTVPAAPSLPSVSALPAAVAAPAATTYAPATQPATTMPPSTTADPYRRSTSSLGSSNGWGSIPAPPSAAPSTISTPAGDLGSTPPSYSSPSAYSSSSASSGATGGGMATYRQNRYGYGSPSDSIPSGPSSSMASSTIPDATSLSGSAPSGLGSSGASAPRRDDGTYKVRPNDNFWTISEKLYGTGAYFKALAEMNRDRSSRDDHLRVGTVLQAPTVDELEKNYPDLCPKANHRRQAGALRTVSVSTMQGMGRRIYTVEQGDTLMDISRRQLGKASRWAEILELNRDKLGEDHDYLLPGMQLALPEPSVGARGRNDSVAERTGLDYRR